MLNCCFLNFKAWQTISIFFLILVSLKLKNAHQEIMNEIALQNYQRKKNLKQK